MIHISHSILHWWEYTWSSSLTLCHTLPFGASESPWGAWGLVSGWWNGPLTGTGRPVYRRRNHFLLDHANLERECIFQKAIILKAEVHLNVLSGKYLCRSFTYIYWIGVMRGVSNKTSLLSWVTGWCHVSLAIYLHTYTHTCYYSLWIILKTDLVTRRVFHPEAGPRRHCSLPTGANSGLGPASPYGSSCCWPQTSPPRSPAIFLWTKHISFFWSILNFRSHIDGLLFTQPLITRLLYSL